MTKTPDTGNVKFQNSVAWMFAERTEPRGPLRRLPDTPAMYDPGPAVGPLVLPTPVNQSRKSSLIETVTSTAIGFVVSLVLTATVMPAFGYPTTWSHDFWITVIFTVASIARGYGVRRSFETGLWRRWIRS